MSVSKMKLISIFGIYRDLNIVSKILGDSGKFQPDEISRFYSKADIFTRIPANTIAPDSLKLLEDTLSLLGKSSKKLRVFHDFSLYECSKFVNDFNKEVLSLFQNKREFEENLKSLYEDLKILENFSDVKEDLSDIFSCEIVSAFFGKIPKNKLEILSEKNSADFVYKICKITDDEVWLIYFSGPKNKDEVKKIFSELMFEDYDKFRDFKGTVKQNISKINEEIEEINRGISNIVLKIKNIYKENESMISKVYTCLMNEIGYYNIEKHAVKYGTGFVLVGWISAEDEEYFSKLLENINGLEITTESAGKLLDFSPPVKLKNNKFFKPFEFFINMYGLPKYNEVDPTPLVAITYVLLFGVMFADFGQGIIISLAGWFMKKYKKMGLGQPLVACGISSSIFGIVFGSFFGFEHAFDWFYKWVFNMDEKPIEVMQPVMINKIIYISIGLGVIFMLIAMLSNIYATIKTRDFVRAIFGQNGICGIIMYIAIIFLLLDKFLIKSGLTNIFYILGLIVFPMLFIMNQEIFEAVFRRKKIMPNSLAEYITVNLFELLEVIMGFATNTMSFLRVGAFILVHAGIMQVFFTIAQMSPILYWPIIILGNVFVIVLEGFLVGVQVMRLEYYEMFSRFYEGGGRAFEPVTVNFSES